MAEQGASRGLYGCRVIFPATKGDAPIWPAECFLAIVALAVLLVPLRDPASMVLLTST